ncbi:hypothetical protein [Ohtaekwangia sp.]
MRFSKLSRKVRKRSGGSREVEESGSRKDGEERWAGWEITVLED